MNERDSLQVAEMLQNRGFSMTNEQAEADVILINTCSVRDQAEQKALNKMGSMQHLRTVSYTHLTLPTKRIV